MEVNVKKFAAMFDKIPSRLVFPGGHLEAWGRCVSANRKGVADNAWFNG